MHTMPSARRRLRSLLVTLLVTVATSVATLAVASAPADARSSYIVLVQGDRGSQVVTLQRYLYVRPASGYFGPITHAAVLRWQRRHHRHQTGLVGRFLWSRAVANADRSPEPSRGGDRVVALNWPALATCESGGNPRAYNPAGYYGLYQFSLSTWRGVGGTGSPSRASSSEQTMRAQALFRRSGSSPWPVCGHHLFD